MTTHRKIMKLIIIRHGETVEKAHGILQGHLPGTLSPSGIEQAERLALWFKDEKIDAIYTSDLARAVDTAKIISQFHVHSPLHLVIELRERNLGIFEGKRKEDVEWVTTSTNYLHPEGGESLKDTYKRAVNFLELIKLRHKSETVLIVAHQDINLALMTAIIHKQAVDILKLGQQRESAFNIFEIDEDGHYKIIALNSTVHLTGVKA